MSREWEEWKKEFDERRARETAEDEDRQLTDRELCRGERSIYFYDRLTRDGGIQARTMAAGGLSSNIYACRRFSSTNTYRDPNFPVVTIYDRGCLQKENPQLRPVQYNEEWLTSHPKILHQIQTLQGEEFFDIRREQAEREYKRDKERGYHEVRIEEDGDIRYEKRPGTRYPTPMGYYLHDLASSAMLYADEEEWASPTKEIRTPQRCVKEIRTYISHDNAEGVARNYFPEWYKENQDKFPWGTGETRETRIEVAKKVKEKLEQDTGKPVTAFVCEETLNLAYPYKAQCKPI